MFISNTKMKIIHSEVLRAHRMLFTTYQSLTEILCTVSYKLFCLCHVNLLILIIIIIIIKACKTYKMKLKSMDFFKMPTC